MSLRSGTAGGFDTETKTDFVTVWVPPTSGPIAEFEGTPLTGTEPLTVEFDFVDLRAGTVTYTNYEWDFTNDGTFDVTGAARPRPATRTRPRASTT